MKELLVDIGGTSRRQRRTGDRGGRGAQRVVRATRRDRAPATADVRPLLPLIDN